MYLRSLTLKGFKSFPHRTRLEFGPGISVIVGPNGSGKSNITDAVLWALGEQSPLAVRGQTMRDVLFAGGAGVPSASVAEVEVVIDNSDGRLQSDFSEISIVRRLHRSGEGEYRLNGARCRLADVLEVLSDTGLGKEMHSVVSQGRVEQIVMSRPRERRLVIEEAAGLGKHRKRRHRAQLKLERTRANLERLLDIEREARTRLRPLRRQAEAAEQHARLERQELEVRYELARDALRAAEERAARASERERAARAALERVEQELAAIGEQRSRCERELAARAQRREAAQASVHALEGAAERVAMRVELLRERERAARERRELTAARIGELEEELRDLARRNGAETEQRIAELERELAELDARREERKREQLAELERELDTAREQLAAAERAFAALDEQRRALVAERDRARERLRATERELSAARRESAQVGSELAAVNQFLARAGAPLAGRATVIEGIACAPGFELALAAALGALLDAAVVPTLDDALALLAGERTPAGAQAVVAGRARRAAAGAQPPCPGAVALRERVEAKPELAAFVDAALADVWVVDTLAAVPADFGGLAVTREGESLDGRTGAVARVVRGGAERVLEERRRRDELARSAQAAAEREHAVAKAVQAAARAVDEVERRRDELEIELRERDRARSVEREHVRRLEWALEERRQAPADEGPDGVRRAEIAAELKALRVELEQRAAAQRRAERELETARGAIRRHETVATAAARAAAALERLEGSLRRRSERLAAVLRADEGDEGAASRRLRDLATRESELQRAARAASEELAAARVEAARSGDAVVAARDELAAVAGRLELDATARTDPLAAEERAELEKRRERLARRRAQLGPVNPLAKEEYERARAELEELEAQRRDLEDAIAELDRVIAETDRMIREGFRATFEAAARNFEEVVAHLFPGGRGRLRLVDAEVGPQPLAPTSGAGADRDAAQDGDESEGEGAPTVPEHHGVEREPGVEVEVTPAGKATRRLSLLSGGEKSLVALAFLMAVFLARPCPFYILDEVEAALDDVNIERFLALLRRYSDRAQFIVVTHQKRTMDAADTLYGVSMGRDGISRVVSRRLRGRPQQELQAAARSA